MLPQEARIPPQSTSTSTSFAQQTGGRYFYGLNDLDRYIGNSLDVGNHFYTLSYRPPPDAPDTKDGTYHTIKISMNRPGLTATTRQGFYTNTSPEPPPTMHELGFALGQAATGGMSYTGVGVHVLSVAPAEKPGTRQHNLQNRKQHAAVESASRR